MHTTSRRRIRDRSTARSDMVQEAASQRDVAERDTAERATVEKGATAREARARRRVVRLDEALPDGVGQVREIGRN